MSCHLYASFGRFAWGHTPTHEKHPIALDTPQLHTPSFATASVRPRLALDHAEQAARWHYAVARQVGQAIVIQTGILIRSLIVNENLCPEPQNGAKSTISEAPIPPSGIACLSQASSELIQPT